MNDDIRRCTRCILPENYPGITFDESGVCSKCRAWERRWSNFDYKKPEEYVQRLFEAARKKGNRYDCVIGLSGGKDSSYAVYLLTQKYKLNPLCVHFDNGFVSPHALENIERVANTFNIDHVSFKADWELMKRLYKHFLLTAGEVCSPCMVGITSSLYKAAKQYNVPMIISGWGPRTETDMASSIYHVSTDYFLNVTKGYFKREEIEDFLHSKTLARVLYHLTGRIRYIQLPVYVKWDEREVVHTIEKKIEWQAKGSITTEHTDCMLTSLKDYLRMKALGFSEKTQKFSVNIRNGSMTREEALAQTEAYESEVMEDKSWQIHEIMQMLDCSEKELAEAEKKRQKPYLPKFTKLLEKDNLMKTLYYRY